MKRLSLTLAMLTLGCSDAQPGPTGLDNGNPAADMSTVDGAWPGPDEVAEGDRYQSGPYLCCAEGEGTACCGEDDAGVCFQYGGIGGGCTTAGNTMEAKDICSHCCAGLARLSPAEDLGEGCTEAAPPSVFVCVDCGDGVCGEGENECVCPDDCPG